MIDARLYYSLYILLALFCMLFAYSKTEILSGANSRWNVVVCVLFISLAIALLGSVRPEQSADTANYYRIYADVLEPGKYLKKLLIFGSRKDGIEVAFVFLFSLLKSLSLGFRTILFVIAFVNALLILSASIGIANMVNNNAGYSKLFALFVSYFGLHYCCIAIRAGLSIGIGLFALYCLLSKKYLSGTVLMYISLLLHTMSVLLIMITGFVLLYCRRKKEPADEIVNRRLGMVLGLCSASLLLNLGSRAFEIFVRAFQALSEKMEIDSFAGYMVNFDMAVGIKDWFIVIAIGLTLYAVERTTTLSRALSWVIIIGLLITSFLYPIRAVNRAADYCYFLLLPLICSLDPEKQYAGKAAIPDVIIYPMLLAVQFSL